MTAPAGNGLQFLYVIYIATTTEELWSALTTGEATEQYFFGRRVEAEWRVGGHITYWENPRTVDIQGQILAYDPPRKLSFTFMSPSDTTARKQPTRVTFELKAIGRVVRLRLVHENLIPQDFEENPDVFQGLNNGWPAILSNLKTFLETGRPLGLTARRDD